LIRNPRSPLEIRDYGSRIISARRPLDREYKKMMTWVAIALVASIVAALVIVEIVIRKYGT
jgi:hypothetical protein